jgi:hypothetical protein
MKKLFIASAVLAASLVAASSPFAAESQNTDAVKSTQSSVFEAFKGSEQMASLSEQDKTLTGAGWVAVYGYYWVSQRVGTKVIYKQVYGQTGWRWVNSNCPLTGAGSLSTGCR